MKRGEYQMCGRKKRYTTRDAHKAANRINSRQAKRVHLYTCPFCGQKHVGKDRWGMNELEDYEPISQQV